MSLFDRYKCIIFPNEASQAKLLQAIDKHPSEAKTFDKAYALLFEQTKDIERQKILAPFLRTLAVEHLRDGNTETTRNIKQQYTEIVGGVNTQERGDAPTFEDFLHEQGRNGVYANDLAAVALAEVLNVTFAATHVNKQYMAGEAKPFVYHKAHEPNTLIFHLFNYNNNHFFITEGHYGSTFGDGNCFYNGFAQIIYQHIQYEKDQELALGEAYKSQHARYQKIKNIEPTPIAELIRAYRESLSGAEKADHDVATRVAREEFKNAKKRTHAFNNLIQLIRTKAQAFPKKHAAAKQAAETLADSLTQSFASYTAHKITYEAFKKQSLDAIDASKEHLEPHRDWENILINLAAAVLGLGIPLIYNRVTTGHWFFKMPVYLSDELTDIKNELENLDPSSCCSA